MRVALTLLVVLALGALGVRAGMRLLDGSGADEQRAAADAVAATWVEATNAQDLARLAELAAERVDADELQDTHTTFLAALPQPPLVVLQDVVEDGNTAEATLAWTAELGDGATWTWSSQLPLIRGRGLWSSAWRPTALHPSFGPRWSVEVEREPATRVPILDRLGRPLSRTGAVVEVGVQPGRLPDEDRLLPAVATALPEAFDALVALLDRDDLNPDWFYPLVTISGSRADEAWPDLLALSGMIRRDAEAGVGPAVAAPEIIGAVAESDDGRRAGISGLEQVYDEQLQGSAVTRVWLLDPEGKRRETLLEHQESPSPPLVSTIDRDVQRAVDDALLAQDGNVALVAMDPATAGVLAVASRPTTGYARALEGRYPPGAVAGLIPLTATLQDGASLDDGIDCPASATIGGVRVTTRDPAASPSRPTLRDVLGGGCDVGLAQLGVRVGGDAMLDAVRLLGLDAELELPVPSSFVAWPKAETTSAQASAAVGHAQVTMSALAGASLAAATARGAPAVPVVLGDQVRDDVTPLSASVRTGLREVLRRAGETGGVRAAGVRVAGATARAGGVGGDPAPATGWWFGFLEGAGPDVAFAVVVEGDDGTTATAIAQRVLDELLGGAADPEA